MWQAHAYLHIHAVASRASYRLWAQTFIIPHYASASNSFAGRKGRQILIRCGLSLLYVCPTRKQRLSCQSLLYTPPALPVIPLPVPFWLASCFWPLWLCFRFAPSLSLLLIVGLQTVMAWAVQGRQWACLVLHARVATWPSNKISFCPVYVFRPANHFRLYAGFASWCFRRSELFSPRFVFSGSSLWYSPGIDIYEQCAGPKCLIYVYWRIDLWPRPVIE